MKANYGSMHTRVLVKEEDFTHLDLSAYHAFREEMEANGFRYLADYEILEVTNSPGTLLARTMLRAMVSREGNVVAGYYQTKPRVWRRVQGLLRGLLNLRFMDAPRDFAEGMKTRHCVDFSTEFEDCTFLCTSNAEGAAKMTSPPEIDN